MRVLAVDDSLTDLTLLRELIGRELAPSDELLTAETGEDALAICRTQPVDLILTDLLLPNLTGLDLLVQARKIRPATEVLVITCSHSVEMAVAAVHKGARDYLTKPINAALLSEKIRNVRDHIAQAGKADTAPGPAGVAARQLAPRAQAVRDLLAQLEAILAGQGDDRGKTQRVRTVLERFRQDQKDVLQP